MGYSTEKFRDFANHGFDTKGLETLSDDDLVDLSRHGSEAAFKVLYERYRQKIVNFAFLMLRDREAAPDVLQDTFLYFLKKIPDYRPEGKLALLLYRVARNLCLNRLRGE